MQPGDRLFAALVQEMEPGAVFTPWPLHVTLVPWFRLGKSTAELANDVRRELDAIKPFRAAAGEEASFGRPRKPVNLIAPPTPFSRLEQRLREYLHRQHAWLVDETTNQRPPYRPHVTVQAAARLQLGDRFTCNSIYLIEQRDGYKEVAAKLPLGKVQP
jgi:2'-5' RNA ligase